MLNEIIALFNKEQPELSACRVDGKSNSDLLEEILQPLINADPNVVNKLKVISKGQGDSIAADLHLTGDIIARVSVDETFTIGFMVCMTEQGRKRCAEVCLEENEREKARQAERSEKKT